MRAISVNEVPALRVCRDVMSPTEHGSQHGVFIAPQGRQACGKVGSSNIKGDDLRKLERNRHSFQTGSLPRLVNVTLLNHPKLGDHLNTLFPVSLLWSPAHSTDGSYTRFLFSTTPHCLAFILLPSRCPYPRHLLGHKCSY